MAYTYQYGDTLSQAVSGGTAKVRPFLYYQTTTANNKVTLSVSAGFQILNSSLNMSTGTATVALSGTGQTGGSGSSAVKTSLATNGYITCVQTKTWEWSRGTTAATKTVSAKLTFSQYQLFNPQTSTATLSVSVPALASYTVSYSGNGATSGSVSSQTKYYGTALTLRSNAYTKTGYTFSKWKATNGTLYSAGGSYTANEGTTMTAQWTANSYTVTFNPNGGSFGGTTANSTKTVTYGATTNNSPGAASRSLYNFNGWYTAASGGTQVFNASGNCVSGTYWSATGSSGTWKYTGNLTVYAQWTLAYTKPTITNLTAYRVYASDTDTPPSAKDDGETIYISFNYTEGSPVGGSTTCTITIGADTYTPSLSGGSYNSKYSTYSKDQQWTISVKIADNNYPTGVTVTRSVGSATYPVDLLASGNNVYMGVMHPAVSGKELTLPSTNLDGVITSTRTDGISFLQTSNTKGHDIGFRAIVDDSVNNIHSNLFFGIGGTGVNRGIYDTTAGAWTIRRDSTSNVKIEAPLVVTGAITAGEHDSAIGTGARVSGTAKTYASVSNWQSTSDSNSVTLTAGSWLIIFTGVFAANGTTGTRAIRPNAGGIAYAYGQSQVSPANNNQHTLTCVFVDTTSASKTYYAEIYQNGGSNESITVHIQYMRIA